jgi:hypothetical protein
VKRSLLLLCRNILSPFSGVWSKASELQANFLDIVLYLERGDSMKVVFHWPTWLHIPEDIHFSVIAIRIANPS